ncbi:MAG: gliding motility-associated C-terminal domain-containing protein [Bacteroidetes bacterium]|nr:gliding motility-associated C-terminal domain-containing protein [Bacteroidota bacterium]
MAIRELFSGVLILFAAPDIFSQAPGCPDISAGPDQNLTCLNNCTTLTATLIQSGQTSNYTVSSIPYAPPSPFTGGTQILINIDDVWGSVINLPFTFCFYGNFYNQIVVGANGLITFDVSQANQYCEWSFTASIPTPGPPSSGGLYNNTIMGAYHDLDPSYGGDINYFITGSAPCRMFVINYSNVPHFDCNCFLFADCKRSTQQIVIYETTNVIEVYIQQKQTCATWNNGNAVIGIQNSTGSAGVAAPGRNTGPWTAANEAWRFTPSGAPNYTVNWYDQFNNTVGSGISVSVCPSSTINYIAEGVYQHCDGSQVLVYDTLMVNVPGGFTTSLSQTNTTCSSCIGTATVTTSGGTPPFTFNIGSGNQSSGNFTGLCAGNYSVTVTDASGCSGNVPVTITAGAQTINATAASADITCNGSGNGSVNLTVSGGSLPYTFNWSNAAITEDLSILAPGTYTVTVTDFNGCTNTASATITEPAALAKTFSQTDILCSGDSTGSVTINISGGTGSYTYVWIPSVSSGNSAGNLVAGSYLVTITDSNGCTITQSFTVTQPSPLSLSLTYSQPNCTDSSGSITAVVSGGVTAYSYFWMPSGTSINPLSGIPAGVYSVTVTDANSCTVENTLNLTPSGSAQVTVSAITGVSCAGGNDGTATVTASGSPPFTYLWIPTNQVTSTATNLTAGSYTVYVTDNTGCTSNTSLTVTEPTPLIIAGVRDSADCYGSTDGSIDIAVSGGSPSYTYLWSDSSVSEDIIAGAGFYTVTVTDSKSCTITYTDSINEPAPMVLLTVTNPATCNQADGSVAVSVTGGTGIYSYYWLPGGASTAMVNNLYAGLYIVTVTDSKGCTGTDVAVISNSNAPVLTVISLTNSTCYGDSNGTITVSATGGTPPLTFSWNTNPPQAGATATGLTEGNYSVSVTDSIGCIVILYTNITEPDTMITGIYGTDTICEGDSITIGVTVTGGTPPYNFFWDQGLPQGQIHVVSPQITTTYTVIAVDINGCTGIAQTVTITTDIPLAVTAAGISTICEGDIALLSATGSGGGGGPYTFQWSTGEISNQISVAPPTGNSTYGVTITDNCGSPPATDDVTISVQQSALLAPPPQQGCPGSSYTLSASGANSYWWSTVDNPLTSIGTGPDLLVTPQATTFYIIHGFDGTCNGSDTVQVTVIPPPAADFNIKPDTTTLLNPTVVFTDASSPDVVTWQWDFGDAATDTLPNTFHDYSDTGTYFITLSVINGTGCSSDITLPLRIDPEFMLFMPNAFTPGKDGNNDWLLPLFVGVHPQFYRFTVFDRWGDLIFETTDLLTGWDGKANNSRKYAQQDVYVWTIEARDFNRKVHYFIGHVTLVK